MEQKNENQFLMLKNYNNFLIDLGLNIFFSIEDNVNIKQNKLEQNPKTIKELDDYIRDWQTKNSHHFISRNDNISSKIFLLLSEENNFINFDQFKKNQPELLDKMFASIGQNTDNFFVINFDLTKIKESYLNRINEILELHITIINPRILIDMCSKDLNKFCEVNKLNLNIDYFKIPSVSDIIKKQNLKREAWIQLKLLKAKLDEF